MRSRIASEASPQVPVVLLESRRSLRAQCSRASALSHSDPWPAEPAKLRGSSPVSPRIQPSGWMQQLGAVPALAAPKGAGLYDGGPPAGGPPSFAPARRSRQAPGCSGRSQDNERHSDVLDYRRRDHEEVEDLVVAEDGARGIRPAEHVRVRQGCRDLRRQARARRPGIHIGELPTTASSGRLAQRQVLWAHWTQGVVRGVRSRSTRALRGEGGLPR